MCFGSINPDIQHGASQEVPSRVVDIHSSKGPRFHDPLPNHPSHPSPTSFSKDSFSKESKLEFYPGWTVTPASFSRQKTKVVRRQSSFDREQARLPIEYGWTDALGKDPRKRYGMEEKRAADKVKAMSVRERSKAVQESLSEERKKKARPSTDIVGIYGGGSTMTAAW